MRQIFDCLRVKARSLYHHFTSKEDLVRHALQLFPDGQAARLLAIEATGAVNEQLRMYAELFAEMQHHGSCPCMYLMTVREPSFPQKECINELRMLVKGKQPTFYRKGTQPYKFSRVLSHSLKRGH